MPAVNPGTTNLIAWWSLNETSGTRNDSHGTNHLAPTGGVSYAAGKVGNAVDLEDTTSSYLSCADNPTLSGADVDWTWCAWVNLESKVAQGNILSHYKTQGNNRAYQLATVGAVTTLAQITVSSDGTFTTGGTLLQATTFGGLATNTWYFLVAYHNATSNTIGISVNAGVFDTAVHSGGIYNASSDFAIGITYNNVGAAAQFFDGLIDEVCIYKGRVLTADEITWLYNAGTGRAYSALSAAKGLPVIEHWHNTMYLR